MQPAHTITRNNEQHNWWATAWKHVLRWFRLTNETVVRVYHGYGQSGRYVIYGHVLTLSDLPRRRFSNNILRNTAALIRLFIVKPKKNVKLQLHWEGQVHHTLSEDDGFFKIEWHSENHLPAGWHPLEVQMLDDEDNVICTSHGQINIPHPTQLGFISDIDDTFLVSHSSNFRRRLLVLFTRNARSRKPFEGVVRHYQALKQAGTTEDAPNPFFYVSSSEWNLFHYIHEFIRTNGLPEGVFLLSQLKGFMQLLTTGQNRHVTKFMRIVRILEHYPTQKFVLLGDSSQMDPDIYASISQHFPKQVHAVYIRDVHRKNQQKTKEILDLIESAGVPCCFFEHSEEAFAHSQRIGLIR